MSEETLDISNLNLESLPHELMAGIRHLPQAAAFYFVLDDDQCCLYIGLTANLRVRFYGHNKMDAFTEHGASRIAYLLATDETFSKTNEMLLINHFAPSLNIRKRTDENTEFVTFTLRLPEYLLQKFKAEAAMKGISLTQLLAMILAERYAKEAAA